MEANTLMSQSRVFRPVWPVNNGLVLCPFPATNPLTHTRAFCCFTRCFLLSPLFTSCTRRLTYISATLKHTSALLFLSGRRGNQTLFFSMTLANSPVHTKQWCGVMSRKQSPLFREDARGSTSLVWTCRRPE